MSVWSFLILIFCFYTATAQFTDSSSKSPKWIWWGYDNSKMPFSVVTAVSLDSKNKVWLSFCDSENGGIGNFTRTDMSDFYHFNKDTYPGFFGPFNRCVMSIAVGKEDTAYFAKFLSGSSVIVGALDSFIVKQYLCHISGQFQKIRYVNGLIHATNSSGLLRLGDTICEVLRHAGPNATLTVAPNEYAYYQERYLILTGSDPNTGFVYETDTGWVKLETGYAGSYNTLCVSPDFDPALSGRGYIYFSMLDSGLFLMKAGVVSRYLKEQMGTASNRVIVIKEDAQGTLWVGTTAGLSTLKNGVWQSFDSLMPWLEGAYITDIQFDHRGNTWISSNSGLTVYNPKGVYWDNYKPIIPQLKIYPNPFTDEIKLETDPDYKGIIQWELYDLYGRQIDAGNLYKKVASYLPQEIQIARINVGIYILRCQFDNGHTLSTKLLKVSP